MSNNIFPDLPGLSFSVTRKPTFTSKILTTANGKELRARETISPMYNFSLSYEFLRDNVQFKELQKLASFFMNLYGEWDTFLFQDPDDCIANGMFFGIGDGTTTTFQLMRSFGDFVEPVLNASVENTLALMWSPDNLDPMWPRDPNPNMWTLGTGPYTVSPNARITFDTAPAAGQRLYWSGVYYFRCRFDKDALAFEKFMNTLWANKKCGFIGALTNKLGANSEPLQPPPVITFPTAIDGNIAPYDYTSPTPVRVMLPVTATSSNVLSIRSLGYTTISHTLDSTDITNGYYDVSFIVPQGTVFIVKANIAKEGIDGPTGTGILNIDPALEELTIIPAWEIDPTLPFQMNHYEKNFMFGYLTPDGVPYTYKILVPARTPLGAILVFYADNSWGAFSSKLGDVSWVNEQGKCNNPTDGTHKNVMVSILVTPNVLRDGAFIFHQQDFMYHTENQTCSIAAGIVPTGTVTSGELPKFQKTTLNLDLGRVNNSQNDIRLAMTQNLASINGVSASGTILTASTLIYPELHLSKANPGYEPDPINTIGGALEYLYLASDDSYGGRMQPNVIPRWIMFSKFGISIIDTESSPNFYLPSNDGNPYQCFVMFTGLTINATDAVYTTLGSLAFSLPVLPPATLPQYLYQNRDYTNELVNFYSAMGYAEVNP